MENPFNDWHPVIFRSTGHYAEVTIPESPQVMQSNAIFFFQRLWDSGFRYLGEGSRGTIVCEKTKKIEL